MPKTIEFIEGRNGTLTDLAEYKAYKRRCRNEKIVARIGVVSIIAVASVIAWKLDPINRALEARGIVLTED